MSLDDGTVSLAAVPRTIRDHPCSVLRAIGDPAGAPMRLDVLAARRR